MTPSIQVEVTTFVLSSLNSGRVAMTSVAMEWSPETRGHVCVKFLCDIDLSTACDLLRVQVANIGYN